MKYYFVLIYYSVHIMSFNREDVEKIYNKIKKMKQKGKNADYIPDLKKVIQIYMQYRYVISRER